MPRRKVVCVYLLRGSCLDRWCVGARGTNLTLCPTDIHRRLLAFVPFSIYFFHVYTHIFHLPLNQMDGGSVYIRDTFQIHLSVPFSDSRFCHLLFGIGVNDTRKQRFAAGWQI